MNKFPAALYWAACLMAMSFKASAADSIAPFKTDGCSLFFDRSPVSQSDWCHCCVTHDIAYWRGGSEALRLAADQALATCVSSATNNDALATLMYAGVRAMGSAHLPTWFRWGFGWPYGRGYKPLSQEEEMAASAALGSRPYAPAYCQGDTAQP